MGIQNKIEEIRRQPEHVRMRYVWIWTAVSMVFVLTIWFVSMASQRKESSEFLLQSEQDESLQDISEQGKTLQDQAKNMKQSFENIKDRGNDSPIPYQSNPEDELIPEDSIQE